MPCAAEAHEQIGEVESLIRKLKQDVRTVLNGQEAVDPFGALTSVVAAHNTMERVQGRPQARFLPGDLVYYKRVKPPADSPANPMVSQKLWRWWGPARVLATETRTDLAGEERHASEREKAIADHVDSPVASWTFHSLLQGVESGQYDRFDNRMFPEDLEMRRFAKQQHLERMKEHIREADFSKNSIKRQKIRRGYVVENLNEEQDGGAILEATGPENVATGYFVELEMEMPENRKQWKLLQNAPEAFYVKKIRGAEVNVNQLTEQKKKEFDEAKEAEISQWLRNEAVRRSRCAYRDYHIGITNDEQ
ncbi:unnamed protein product, partial [Effrenium voratum]